MLLWGMFGVWKLPGWFCRLWTTATSAKREINWYKMILSGFFIDVGFISKSYKTGACRAVFVNFLNGTMLYVLKFVDDGCGDFMIPKFAYPVLSWYPSFDSFFLWRVGISTKVYLQFRTTYTLWACVIPESCTLFSTDIFYCCLLQYIYNVAFNEIMDVS